MEVTLNATAGRLLTMHIAIIRVFSHS